MTLSGMTSTTISARSGMAARDRMDVDSRPSRRSLLQETHDQVADPTRLLEVQELTGIPAPATALSRSEVSASRVWKKNMHQLRRC